MGLLVERLLRGAGTHGPLVLMYHGIEAGVRRAAWRYGLALSDFESHLDLLAEHGWRTLTLAQAHQAMQEGLRGGGGLPERRVVITFDDGYADNLAAVEALARRGMVASWFIVSGCVGATPNWPDPELAGRRMLGRQALREMAEQGMEIGGHSRSHARLSEADAREVTAQVAGCKFDLEALLERPVESFAYPFGDHDGTALQAVRQAGFRRAVSVHSGVWRRDASPWLIPRLTVYNDDDAGRLAQKLAFASNTAGPWAVARYALSRLAGRLGGGG